MTKRIITLVAFITLLSSSIAFSQKSVITFQGCQIKLTDLENLLYKHLDIWCYNRDYNHAETIVFKDCIATYIIPSLYDVSLILNSNESITYYDGKHILFNSKWDNKKEARKAKSKLKYDPQKMMGEVTLYVINQAKYLAGHY